MSDFLPGTLWQRVVETSQIALRNGDLLPIRTAFEFLEDAEVRFLVRIVESLARKPQGARSTTGAIGSQANPFLPYDRALYVADAGPDHVCLLNKFNVVDHHLLIVTRQLEHQQVPLGVADFAAWWRCLIEYESLGFYNGGTQAGASQPHKHLQLVPLPLADTGPRIPIEPLLAMTDVKPRLNPCSRLPFQHAAVRLDESRFGSLRGWAEQLHAHYRHMLELTELSRHLQTDGRLSAAYNLLLTRQWMLLVLRRHEHFSGISLNAMAFAGALLTRDEEQLATLRRVGPMAALRHVAMARSVHAEEVHSDRPHDVR